MGWSSGSYLAQTLWKQLKPYIEPKDYGAVSKIIYERFCECDADDWEIYPKFDCLYYVYLRENNPEELKEFDLEEE